MDWLSKAQKEEAVIQLYKENKSFREIATLMLMSFRDIGGITKKVERDCFCSSSESIAYDLE